MTLLQQFLPFTVSTAGRFDSGRVRVGVDGGKVEWRLSVPPVFTLCIFAQVRMFSVNLGRDVVLV